MKTLVTEAVEHEAGIDFGDVESFATDSIELASSELPTEWTNFTGSIKILLRSNLFYSQI